MEAALGLDLGSLLSQLTATQQAKTSAKLSERNVVELINKLRQLGILSEGELLHTLNGKEYMTVERLRAEVQKALRQAGGRLALVELPSIVGVDLIHCERQVAAIIAGSGGTVQEVNGELITTQYLDTIASEINDQLQESGQINVGELAAQYGLATELVMNVVTSRLGTVIQGRLEGGLLYTQSYLRAIKAQLRGALRATTGPVVVAALLKEVGLGVTGDAAAGGGGGGLAAALAAGGGGGVIATLIEELVQEGSLRGSLKGGGSSWTPAVYGEVASEAVANFYSQNGWVGYDTVRRMGISNERAHLRAAFPDGIALESAYIAPQLVATLEAAVEDVVAANAHPLALASGGPSGGGGGGTGGWVDVGPLLPSALGPADVAALLGRLAVLKDQERRPAKERKAHVVGGTWVLSAALITALQDKVDAEARALAHKALAERKASSGAAAVAGTAAAGGGGGGGKGGKKGGAAAAAAADDDDDDDWSMGPKGKAGKGKKGGGGGGKAAAAGGKGGAGGAKDAGGKGGGKDGGGGAAGGGVSAGWIASKLPGWCPDMDWEDDGGGGEDKAAAVAALLLGGAVTAYEQALQAAFTAGAEERRRAKDSLAKSLEEAYGRLLLYGAGAEGFADDEATHTTLQRHALRTTGAECVDLLHRWARAEYQPEGGEGTASASTSSGFLTAAEIKALVRAVPPDVAEGLAAAAEVPGAASVREAEPLLDRAAAAVGVRLKKLDKKSEKAALAALRERLLSQLAAEAGDPPAALALMVPLAHLRITGKAVSLPGKALGPVLARLGAAAAAEGGGVSEELAGCVRGLAALHEGVVEYLKAQSSSAPGAGDTGALLERLTGSLPPLKSALGLQVPGGGGAAAAGEAEA